MSISDKCDGRNDFSRDSDASGEVVLDDLLYGDGQSGGLGSGDAAAS